MFLVSLLSNNFSNYGRRHFKLFTNCHVSWNTLYISWISDHFADRVLSLIKSEPIRIGGSCCKPKGRPGRKEGSSQVKAGLYFKNHSTKDWNCRKFEILPRNPTHCRKCTIRFQVKKSKFFLWNIFLCSQKMLPGKFSEINF